MYFVFSGILNYHWHIWRLFCFCSIDDLCNLDVMSRNRTGKYLIVKTTDSEGSGIQTKVFVKLVSLLILFITLYSYQTLQLVIVSDVITAYHCIRQAPTMYLYRYSAYCLEHVARAKCQYRLLYMYAMLRWLLASSHCQSNILNQLKHGLVAKYRHSYCIAYQKFWVMVYI